MVDELKKKVPIWKKPRFRSEPDWRQGDGGPGMPSPEAMQR
jgi:molybdopterin synthase catalytic subunit